MRIITPADYDEIEEQADKAEDRRRIRTIVAKSQRNIIDKRGKLTSWPAAS